MSYEIVGIIGTVIILVAFMQNTEKKIRIFDLIGAACFVAYGILVKAYSNILLNGILIIIQISKLYGIKKRG